MTRPALALLLAAAAAAQVKLPPYSKQVLPNGATIAVLPKNDVPLVSFLAVFRGGQEGDPADRAGLGAAMAGLLERGAGTLSGDAFADKLDSMGATLRTAMDEQSAVVRMECLARDAGPALDLFADAILRPRFDPDEVKKALAEQIDAAKSLKDNPSQANAAYFAPFFFGPRHPYGRPANGDELTLARIGREDIVAHHRRMFAARNLILVAAGATPAGFESEIERRFAAMPAGQAHSWVAASLPPRDAARLLLIDKPVATQTYFTIAQPGIHRTHPDRVPLWIVNTVFGERFTSMLNDELRVNSGLTYGARSELQQERLPGAITIRTFTKTETTVKAIDLAVGILKRLRSKGLDAAQLASSKAYIKGGYPTQRLETADQVAAAIAELELFGLNRGEVDDLFSRIDAVTLEEANAAIRRHFRDDNLQFCLTGDAAKIRDQVAKYAGRRKEIKIAEPGLTLPEF